ncbi:MAG TPA: transposase [Candidatus Angelobacter sp.]
MVQYFAAVLGAAQDGEVLNATFEQQGKRRWNIHIRRFSSKAHFLRYAGRYLRRPPIAEHRIISITEHEVEYWANDLKLKAWVRVKVSVNKFLGLLIQHVPERHAHCVRYFGLASPAGKHALSNGLFALLGQDRKPQPRRLSFEAMSLKYFDHNPLLDSRGQRMRWVRRQAPEAVSVGA